MNHDRFCDEIVAQARQLADSVRDADPATRVPTCPEWTLDDLVNHIRGVLGMVGGVIAPAPDADLTGTAAWFADTMRAAGPDASATVFGLTQPVAFWARRAAHDIAIHRADAALAVGAPYSLAPDLAADGIDELLDLLPQLSDVPVGGSLHLHATDTDAGTDAEWLIERRPDGVAWRHDHGKATVALRGPLTDLLLVFYRRLPSDRVEVLGDAAALDAWLDHTRL
jgi:uncharacterized protein (TIGR03083 family)